MLRRLLMLQTPTFWTIFHSYLILKNLEPYGACVKVLHFSKISNKNRLTYEARFIQWNKHNAVIQHRYCLQNAFTLPIFKLHEHEKGKLFLMNEFFSKSKKQKQDLTKIESMPLLSFKINGLT